MWKKLVKAGGFVIYTLVFGEVFLALLSPQPRIPRYVTAAEYGIRKNIPNTVYRQKTEEVDVEVRINDQGIRVDRNIAQSKPDGVYRVVLLGDSFLMGYEVDLEDSFAYQLETLLQESGINAEVVNLAVSGFGIAESLIALREVGLGFSPDLVILQWHQTDPDDNRRSGLFIVKNSELVRGAKQFLPGVAARDALMKIPGYEWLISNSHLYSAIRERAAGFAKALLLVVKGKKSGAEPVRAKKSRQEPTLDDLLVEKVRAEAEGSGASFLLLDVPTAPTRTKFISNIRLLSRQLVDSVTVLSPVEAFRRASNPDLKIYYEKGHGHWTPIGNEIVAELVADYVGRELLGKMKAEE